MRIFGSERMELMLVKLGLKEDEAIVHPWINKALEKAQQKVEARNFDMRKNILKYDNVMNDQRKVVFEQRREMMAQESLEEMITDMRHGVVDDLIGRHIPARCLSRSLGYRRAGRIDQRRVQYFASARRLGEGGRNNRRGNAGAAAQGGR